MCCDDDVVRNVTRCLWKQNANGAYAMKGRVFYAVCALMVFFFMSFASAAYSEQEQSLAGVKQWVGKYPFDKIDGVTLFNSKLFKSSFKKISTKKIYDWFVDAYKNAGRYFGSTEIKERNGVVEISAQDLCTGFDAKFFADTNNNTFSFCWNDKNTGEEKFFYSDGTTASLNVPCYDINYDDMQKRKISNSSSAAIAGDVKKQSASKEGRSQKKGSQYDKNIIGTWYGEMMRANSNGTKYKYTMKFDVFEDPQSPGALAFQEDDTMKFDSMFSVNSCTNKNLSAFSYKGRIEAYGSAYKFIQTSTDNPKCCQLGIQEFRFNGSTLEAVSLEDGRITSGSFTKIK